MKHLAERVAAQGYRVLIHDRRNTGASDVVWKRNNARDRSYYRPYPNAVTDEFGPRWWTYLVPGHADFGWIEAGPAIGKVTALSLRFEHRDGVSDRALHYRQSIWTLRLIHRF